STSPAENSPFVADEESVVDPEVVTPSVICRHAGCGAPTEGVGPKSQLFLPFGTVAVWVVPTCLAVDHEPPTLETERHPPRARRVVGIDPHHQVVARGNDRRAGIGAGCGAHGHRAAHSH